MDAEDAEDMDSGGKVIDTSQLHRSTEDETFEIDDHCHGILCNHRVIYRVDFDERVDIESSLLRDGLPYHVLAHADSIVHRLSIDRCYTVLGFVFHSRSKGGRSLTNVRFVRTIVLAITLIVLIGLSVPSFANVSQYEAHWNTTADFNSAGSVRTDIDTADQSCLASGQGFQLNATGGFYGISSRCPTGSPSVNKNGLLISLDMSTLSNAGNMLLDFSGRQNKFVTMGSFNETGKFGGSAYIGPHGATLGSSLKCSANTQIAPAIGCMFPQPVASWSVMAWVKLNMTTCGADVCTFMADNRPAAGVGGWWIYFAAPSAGSASLTFRYGTASGTTNVNLGSYPVDNAWHAFVVRVNYTGNNVQAFWDGTLKVSGTMVGSLAPATSNDFFFIGNTADMSIADTFRSSIDEYLFLNRYVTNGEITEFSKSGSYALSGFWASPNVDVENQRPSEIVLGFRNQTAFSYLQSLYIFNESDIEQWHTLDISFATGDANITEIVLPAGHSFPRGNHSYYVEVGLTGVGNGTSVVDFVALLFQPIPAAAIPPISDITLWLTFLLFLIAIVFLSIIGFMYRPEFLLLGGTITLAFAFWTYSAITNLFVTAAFLSLGVGLILLGIVVKPNRGNTKRK